MYSTNTDNQLQKDKDWKAQ